MRVETEHSRNGHRAYSDRKYDDRFRRKTYRHDDHHYHSSRISLKPRHHHNEDYSLKRIGNSPSNYYPDHSRFDRQKNNRDIYSSSLNDQPILNDSPPPPPPPPTDLYYIRERDLSTHYNDSERNRYSSTYPTNKSDQFKPSFRRESSPLPSSSYRNEYRSPTRNSMDSYNELYRSNHYQNHSERYDIPQNRNCSITATSSSSPVYYQTSSSSYNTRDEYTQSFPSMREVDYRTRDYGLTPTIDHSHQTASNSSSNHYRSSYQDRSNLKRSRSNFDHNNSKRPMRR